MTIDKIKKIISAMVFSCLLLINGFVFGQCKEIIGYYYADDADGSTRVCPSDINHTNTGYTIINYAFFIPTYNSTTHAVTLTAPNPGAIAGSACSTRTCTTDVAAFKANFKVVASIGGAGTAITSIFSSIAADPTAIANFATQCASLVASSPYNFDGIDIDWEFPRGATDKANFTALLKAIRNSIGNNKILTITVSGIDDDAKDIQWPNTTTGINVMNYVDMVNVMSYDYYKWNSARAGHNNPLFTSSLNGSEYHPEWCFAESFKLFTSKQTLIYPAPANLNITPYGVPASQVNMGLAFYGRSFKSCSAAACNTFHQASLSTAYACDGTYLKNEGTSSTCPSPANDINGGSHQYYRIKSLRAVSGMNTTNYYDNGTDPLLNTKKNSAYLLFDDATYTSDAGNNVFLSYDDASSVIDKAIHVRDFAGARGVIVWKMTGDISGTSASSLAGFDLINAVKNTFNDANTSAVSYGTSGSSVTIGSVNGSLYQSSTDYVNGGNAAEATTQYWSTVVAQGCSVNVRAKQYITLGYGFSADAYNASPIKSFTADNSNCLCYERSGAPTLRKAIDQNSNANSNGTDNGSNTIVLFPNPSSGKFQLNLRFEKEKSVEVYVYSTMGMEIYNNNLGSIGIGLLEIDLSNENEGMYIVKVKSDNEVTYRKVILTK